MQRAFPTRKPPARGINRQALCDPGGLLIRWPHAVTRRQAQRLAKLRDRGLSEVRERQQCIVRVSRCAYRKSNPAILMVQSTQDRAADDIPGPLNAAMDRGILVQ